MLLRVVIFFLLTLSFSLTAFANKSTNPIFPFNPEMTHAEMMKAAPELGWDIKFRRYSNITFDEHGAKATHPIELAGMFWTVHAGDRYNMGTQNVTSLQLVNKFTPETKKQCTASFSSVVREFESAYGTFGTNPEFRNQNSRLYGDPYDGFKIEKVTDKSIARRIENSSSHYKIYTFREPQLNEFHRTHISASYNNYDTPNCEIKISVYIPYEWDSNKGKEVLPLSLKQKFPSRYKEKDEE